MTPFFVWVLSIYALSGQEFNLLSQPTDAHELIPDTRISIIPPPDYNISERFAGLEFQGRPETAIIVATIPGPFSSTIRRFNEDLLELRNMEVIERKMIPVRGYRCVFINLNHDEDQILYKKFILFIGDENQSFIIQAIAPNEDEDLVLQLREAISSTIISPLPTKSQRSLLDYKVDEKKGDFLLATILSNGMVFTRDGKTPPEVEDKTVIFFDKSHTRLRTTNKMKFAMDRLSQYPGLFKIKNMDDVQKIKRSRLEGYEITAYNSKASNEALKQIILYDKRGAYYVMTAIYDPANNGILADIDRIMKTFKKK